MLVLQRQQDLLDQIGAQLNILQKNFYTFSVPASDDRLAADEDVTDTSYGAQIRRNYSRVKLLIADIKDTMRDIDPKLISGNSELPETLNIVRGRILRLEDRLAPLMPRVDSSTEWVEPHDTFESNVEYLSQRVKDITNRIHHEQKKMEGPKA